MHGEDDRGFHVWDGDDCLLVMAYDNPKREIVTVKLNSRAAVSAFVDALIVASEVTWPA